MSATKPNNSQTVIMLDLQSKLNTLVDKDWISKRFPYLRAAFVEAAEALDHYGWKWWKQQAPDIPQVQMEISDILHFYLSDILLDANGDVEVASKIFLVECSDVSTQVTIDGVSYDIEEVDVSTLFELIAAFSILRRRSLSIFQVVMGRCGLDWASLYVGYVSKNVLNIFRQNNGYKSGAYLKLWDGREDNEHLHDIVQNLDSTSASFSQDIFAALQAKYPKN